MSGSYSILNGNGTGGQPDGKPSRRSRRDERTGSVLPPPSQWSRGPIVYGHATGMSSVGQTGYQAAHTYGTPGGGGVGTTGYGTSAASYATGGLTGTNSLRGGSYGGGTGQGATGGGKLQEKIKEAKEKNRERRERYQAKTRPDQVSQRNLAVDSHGVAHDPEYVQFRTTTPLHVQKRQQAIAENPNDDDSASSSSASSSSSGFHSSPYTYQSTHRTASSSHHPASTLSAIPPYLAGHHRTSIDAGPSSLQVPRAPSPHRGPTSSSSLYGDSTAAYGGAGAYDRMGPGYGSRVTTSKLRSSSNPVHSPHYGHTTASFQPPAPSYAPVGAARIPSSDGASLAESTAQLSLGSGTINGSTNESGYNKAVKAGHGGLSIRPAQLDGSALDAGVHGMKRSWDGFKLDMRLSARKTGTKLSRKLNAL
ncbi:hypothetical protein JCM11251_004377 [Rhodosporidiobolus azoricus]